MGPTIFVPYPNKSFALGPPSQIVWKLRHLWCLFMYISEDTLCYILWYTWHILLNHILEEDDVSDLDLALKTAQSRNSFCFIYFLLADTSVSIHWTQFRRNFSNCCCIMFSPKQHRVSQGGVRDGPKQHQQGF